LRSKKTGDHTVSPRLSIALMPFARNIGRRRPRGSTDSRRVGEAGRGRAGGLAARRLGHRGEQQQRPQHPGQTDDDEGHLPRLERADDREAPAARASVSQPISSPPTSSAMPLPRPGRCRSTEIGRASLSRGKMSLVIE
jgi:hypothetical protein